MAVRDYKSILADDKSGPAATLFTPAFATSFAHFDFHDGRTDRLGDADHRFGVGVEGRCVRRRYRGFLRLRRIQLRISRLTRGRVECGFLVLKFYLRHTSLPYAVKQM